MMVLPNERTAAPDTSRVRLIFVCVFRSDYFFLMVLISSHTAIPMAPISKAITMISIIVNFILDICDV